MISEWAGYGRNRQSVGQLWLGFLHFYAGDWDDKYVVVELKYLSKSLHNWDDKKGIQKMVKCYNGNNFAGDLLSRSVSRSL